MSSAALRYAESLAEAMGMEKEKAQAQILHLNEYLREYMGDNFSTKADIALIQKDIKGLELKIETVKSELRRDIKELDIKIERVKSELKKDIETVKSELGERLTIRIVTVAGLQVTILLAAIIGILNFFPR